MTRGHVATGSGIERAMNCAAASVLPRVWSESSVYAQRGTAIHAHLERLAHGMPEAESLALVDIEHRDAAATIDTASLADDLTLSPEVALAYKPADDTARLIGQGLARDYSTVGLDEIPLTIDLAGRRQDHGVVRDYKTGHRNVTRAGTNWQMIGAALAVSRAFDLDEMEAEVIYVRPGRDVYRDTARLTGLELAGAAAELRALMPRVERDRARLAAGEHVEPTEGSWCQYCPSKWTCPAKVGTLRMGLEIAAGRQVVPAGDLVKARELLRAARKELTRLEEQLDDALSTPVLLDTAPDGTQQWYGAHREPGNEVIDGTIAVAAIAAHLKRPTDEIRDALVGAVTKKKIAELAAKVAPRGAIAATERSLLAAIAAAGGITRPDVERVGHFTQRIATEAA
ncbi:MAG: PD-(D/E)XK nuclease family protein [Rhodospirillaceae bacterium]